ncbi:hypothetical protein M422DRAFT_23189 [Sphaerobolus stellatus SS14]|nr:hypothetical protein M422DRAFT_23189 [Sphaerobolus stellatus SS14]
MNKVAVDIHKIGEGTLFVFVIVFDDGSDIVARVNCSVAHNANHPVHKLYSPEALQSGVASEAATLKFLKENTTIPVPTVYAVNIHPDNSVGMRYMLQERIVGQLAFGAARKFSEQEQERFFKQIIDIEKQLLSVSFPSIGSLIDDPVTGKPVVGPLASLPLLPFYAEDFAHSRIGPWKSAEDMLRDFARILYDLIVNQTALWKEGRLLYKELNGDGDNPPFSFFKTFYQLYMEGVQQLHFDEEFPLILHDLDMTDFMVAYDDPSRIVGVVDWQSTYVLPLWFIVLQSTFASFKAAGEGCRMRRQVFGFLIDETIFTESPDKLCVAFLSAWKGWSKEEREPFQPLIDFIKTSGYGVELQGWAG